MKTRLSVLLLACSLGLLLTVGCSPEAKKAKLLQSADQHYLAGDYDRAELEYLNLVKMDPKSGHAIGRLGMIYTAQGRTGRAIAYLMRGHELLPDDVDLRLKLGQLNLATGQLNEARTEANFILDRHPQDPEAPALLAATAANPDEAKQVRERLQGLTPPAPQSAPVLTALATLELRLGNVPAAEKLLQQAKAADANYAAQYAVTGMLQLSQRNAAAAEESLRQAATLAPARSPLRLQYAQFKIRSGDLAGAGKYLEEIIKNTPDFIPALLALAELNVMQNKLAECDPLLDKVLSRDSQNLEGLILKGRLHNLRSETDKALILFEKLVESYPRVPTIHQELGRAYAAKGDATKAQNSLNLAVSLAPQAVEPQMMLAQLTLRKGDLNAAIALLRKLVEQRPDLPQPRIMLAGAYRNQNSLPEALTLYQQLEKELPQNPQIPLLSGLILVQQGKRTEARRAFERAFALSPDSPAALEQLVNLDLLDKDYAGARKRVETEAAKNKKLEGNAQLLLAKIGLAGNDKTAAQANLDKAIELMPDSPTAYYLLAGMYTRDQQPQKALDQLSEVVKRDPKQVTALTLMSIIQEQLGDFAAAKDSYEKTLAMNPRSIVALNNLAYLYSEKFKDLDKAQDLAQKARQLAPSEPHNADTLGWILFRKGEYSWALNLLQEAAEKLPSEGEIQYHLGVVHYMMGTEGASRTSLQRALELSPTAKWSAEARQYLDLLAIDPANPGATAKALLEKAVTERPGDPVALGRLASVQEREGKVDQAIASLETALKANTHNVNLMLSLARLYGTAKNSAKALEYAKAARKQSPDDPEVAGSLGRLAYQNGDYAWSASLLQEAARKLKATPDLLYDLALANYSVGRVGEAENSLRSALELAGRQPALLFSQSAAAKGMLSLLDLAKNPAEAARQSATVEAALKAAPDSVPALMAAGALNESQRKGEAALALYEKVLKIFPDFLPAKTRLAVLGAVQPTFEQKYFDWALQARSLAPSDRELAKALGILTYRKGDASRAISLLRESAASRPNDAELFYYLGLAELQNKEVPAGKASLEKAIKLGLSADQSAEATKALSAAK